MNDRQDQERVTAKVTWGPWLYWVTFIAVLGFFWWLLIYSHGVTPHGG